MIIVPGKYTFNGKDVLARCSCSHNWRDDCTKYGCSALTGRIQMVGGQEFYPCPVCGYYPWIIKGMDYKQLRKP